MLLNISAQVTQGYQSDTHLIWCFRTLSKIFMQKNFPHTHIKRYPKVFNFSPGLIKRICFLGQDFKRNIEELKDWFKVTEYPNIVLYQQVTKIMQNTLLDQSKPKDFGAPLVVTYKLHFTTVGRTIQKHLYFLNEDDKVKNIFTHPQFLPIKSASNLRNYLLRSKIYPLSQIAGSTKCQDKRW